MAVKFIETCEYAFFSDGTKTLNMIGLFDMIHADRFPAAHPRFSVATSFTNVGSGKHTSAVKLLSNSQKILAEVKNEFETDEGRHNWVHNFVGVIFPEPGKYTIEVLLDGKKVGFTELTAKSI